MVAMRRAVGGNARGVDPGKGAWREPGGHRGAHLQHNIKKGLTLVYYTYNFPSGLILRDIYIYPLVICKPAARHAQNFCKCV